MIYSRYKAAFLTGSTAKNWVKCHNIFFDGKIILSSSNFKVSFLSPFWAVGVPDDPVFGLAGLVKAPTYHQDRVVLRHPGVACLVHAFAFSVGVVRKLHKRVVAKEVLDFLGTHVGDGFGIDLSGLLEFSDSFEAVFAYNTAFVGLEQMSGVKLNGKWSISQ